MDQSTASKAALIAPCGVNCGVCLGYLREKNKCPGCASNSMDKLASRVNCVIRNCNALHEGGSGFCYECAKFPCRRMKDLDKRYRTKYGVSLIDNLHKIRDYGMESFLQGEKEKWTCRTCGGTVCIHRGYCLECGKP